MLKQSAGSVRTSGSANWDDYALSRASAPGRAQSSNKARVASHEIELALWLPAH
jgi:hypothetical protein